ncbi:MAG TPA: glucose-1-phosphate adenylyltransferase [Longilinea sp.]|nr:glucose-1-phosphate adenylyltransferase [Longilinea sp.]
MPSLDEILAVILGGGRGTRLYPLTKMRSKPAVPMAGQYRLIDIPISNCINSGIFHVAVLTQFNSVSLHRHISNTYSFDAFHGGWVQIWAAEQTAASMAWYQGTADAVRKQLFEIRSARTPYVLILAGDHLYRMDYSKMAAYHWENDADITVAVHPVPAQDAGRFGILKRDPQGRITSFAEKPTDPQVLKDLASGNDPKCPYLASMGIYLFKTPVLCDLLENSTFDDFGSQILPNAISTHSIYGCDFDGYWEDIGTIRSFYDTNLALTGTNPPFNFYDPESPIYTHPRFLPGSSVVHSLLENVTLSEGCRIYDAEIRHSIIGLRSQIESGARIVDSILMGCDYYEAEIPSPPPADYVPMGIGADSQIEGAIIDKNVRIGAGVTICPFPRGTDLDSENWVVRDGIVVVPKATTLPPGTVIAPDKT